MTGPRFEAYTECTKCGRLDHHLLREPKPAPSEADMAEWHRTSETFTIEQWGSGVARTETWPPPPVDESQFEVVRICKCGNEWGQL